MEINKDIKESIIEEDKLSQNNTNSLLCLKSAEPEEENNRVVLSIDIILSENNIKTIEIHSGDEIENKINLFCKDNNIPLNIKQYINNSILKELNKNIEKCKFYFI